MGAYFAAPILPMITPTSIRVMARKRLQPQRQDFFLDMAGQRGLILFFGSNQDLRTQKTGSNSATEQKKVSKSRRKSLFVGDI